MSANIRMKFFYNETLDKDITPFVRAFLCDGHGILIKPYHEKDQTIQFQLIEEDDEHWFISNCSFNGASTPDIITVMNAAYLWCQKKALRETPDCPNFKFKPGTLCVKQKFDRFGSWKPIVVI